MKRSSNIFVVLLLSFVIAGAQNPTQSTETAIAKYLQVLKSSDSDARLAALSKLNDLKALYPNYKMKEFDNFLKSKIMEKSSQGALAGLASDNLGVRHSTLHILVRLKSDYPQMDMSLFNNALTKIINQDPIQHLQVDAKIAFIYLNDSQLAGRIKIKESGAPGDTFTQIHIEMDKAFTTENPDVQP